MTVTITIREVVDRMMFLVGVVAERIAVTDKKGVGEKGESQERLIGERGKEGKQEKGVGK